MVLAGVVGSALAGDLGARKIREELDALDVLGVDKMRTLIVPRVVAITIAGLILSLLVVARRPDRGDAARHSHDRTRPFGAQVEARAAEHEPLRPRARR